MSNNSSNKISKPSNMKVLTCAWAQRRLSAKSGSSEPTSVSWLPRKRKKEENSFFSSLILPPSPGVPEWSWGSHHMLLLGFTLLTRSWGRKHYSHCLSQDGAGCFPAFPYATGRLNFQCLLFIQSTVSCLFLVSLFSRISKSRQATF